MAKIDIHREHHLSLPQARAVVDKVAAKMSEKFGTQSQWQADTLKFSRTGVNGTIAVENGAVQVHAELGMLLSPMKNMIEQEIRNKLDEYFA